MFDNMIKIWSILFYFCRLKENSVWVSANEQNFANPSLLDQLASTFATKMIKTVSRNDNVIERKKGKFELKYGLIFSVSISLEMKNCEKKKNLKIFIFFFKIFFSCKVMILLNFIFGNFEANDTFAGKENFEKKNENFEKKMKILKKK